MTDRKCCVITCDALAEWQIWAEDMRDPYNYTDGCTAHIGELLDDSPAFRVTPISEASVELGKVEK